MKRTLIRILRICGLVLLCLLPSLWILTQPFPWITGLEAIATGTIVPLMLFALIGALLLILNSRRSAWLEWAAITLCFAAAQAYVFNTALHPDNRFNLIGGLLPNADPSMYLRSQVNGKPE